jgi:MFS family permease
MRATRLAIGLVFLADGLMLGSWAARVPAVQRQADLSNPRLGLALFAMSLGALVSMPVAGWAGERSGSRRIAVGSLVAGALSLWLASLAGGLAGLAAALFAFGAAFGAVNVSANAQGLALERMVERSILSSFHAAFSAGGLLGAALGAVAAGAAVEPRVHFAVLAAVVVSSAVVAWRRLLPPASPHSPTTPVLALPARPLLAIGAAAFCTLLAEGAAADWSAVYLHRSLDAPAGAAALGYTAFSLAMVASRLVGDRLNERLGPLGLARGGGLLAASGLGLALVVPSVATALVGFAVMGAGLGVIVPVLFRAAGSAPGVPAGVGIAAVSTIGWLGFLAGPALIGFTAGVVGLHAALAIVVAAAALVALLVRAAPQSTAGTSRSRSPNAPACAGSVGVQSGSSAR